MSRDNDGLFRLRKTLAWYQGPASQVAEKLAIRQERLTPGTSGAKAPTYSQSFTAPLKSCPDTKQEFFRSLLATSQPTLLPIVDNYGNCENGTAYTGPVTISSSTTLYAQAGNVWSNPPSTTVAATYTITGGGAASTPTFSPVAGTYPGTQSVALSTSSPGAIICYTTNGATPATNGSTGCATGTLYTSTVSVATSETLEAIAGGTGYADSPVASAGYVVSFSAPVVISGKTVITGKTVLQ